MSDEANMFSSLGQCGFYVNSFGYRQNIILVEDKDNNIIYCKDHIPLGNKVYIGVKDDDSKYIGTVEACIEHEDTTVGIIAKIQLYESNASNEPVYTPNKVMNEIYRPEVSE